MLCLSIQTLQLSGPFALDCGSTRVLHSSHQGLHSKQQPSPGNVLLAISTDVSIMYHSVDVLEELSGPALVKPCTFIGIVDCYHVVQHRHMCYTPAGWLSAL